MSNEIEFEGFEEIEELLHDMTISEEDEKKAMKKALDVMDEGLDNEIPIGKTKKLSKRKKSIKKENFAIIGSIKLTAFYDFMREFGTSQSKKDAGFFERSINKTQKDALNILSKELLDKAN